MEAREQKETNVKKTGIPFIDEGTERLEALEKRSDAAKGLVGKLFTVQVGDGYAYYTVEAEKGQKVLVKWHDIHDAWAARDFKQGGWFSRKSVENEVLAQDGMRKIFEDHGNRQDVARAERRASVLDAIGADLARNADVYDLASWCWQRGHWGKKSDMRIERNEKVLGRSGADALAHDLVDAKLFPAIKALKDGITFVVLADGLIDPAVYKNPPPDEVKVMNEVRRVFQDVLAVMPRVTVRRVESDSLTDTSFKIIMDAFNEIGTVWYDPKDGKVIKVSIAFGKDFRNK